MLLGTRPVTVAVPSFPVVQVASTFPLPSFTAKEVLGTGLPVTESSFVMVREQSGSLRKVNVWVSRGFTVTVCVCVLLSMT